MNVIQEKLNANLNKIEDQINTTLREADAHDWFTPILWVSAGVFLTKLYAHFFVRPEPFKKKLLIQGFNLDTHVISQVKLKLSYLTKSVIGRAKSEKAKDQIDITGSFEGNTLQLWVFISDEHQNQSKYMIKAEMDPLEIKGFSENMETKDVKPFQSNIVKSATYQKLDD